MQIALAQKIAIHNNIIELTMDKLKALPYESTTSMQRDYCNDSLRAEIESLTGYVIYLGNQFGIRTPLFEQMYNYLKPRQITH